MKRYLCLAALLPFGHCLPAPVPVLPHVGLVQNQGFCSGAPAWPSWAEVPKPSGIHVWTSQCDQASLKKAIAVTDEFRAPAHLTLYLLGWMRSDEQGMWLENKARGGTLSVHFDEVPGGAWQRITFAVPASWQGQLVRLRVETNGIDGRGWVGFSEPFDAGELHDYGGALNLFLRLSEYFLLLSPVFFAASALAIRTDFKDLLLILLFGLSATGIAGYLAFWLWFLWPKFAHLYSFLLPIVSTICVVGLWKRMGPPQRKLLYRTARPWLLAFSVALFILAAGFLFGDVDRPMTTPQTRFSHALPIDNSLQLIFSEQIIHHQVLHPMVIDWLSSDRPPLETGFTLLQLPFVLPPHTLAYTILGVLLQSFWAPALWAFLRSFDVGSKISVLTIVAALLSGFVLLNNFFVWPKLLAAAYMLGFSMLLLAPRFAMELRKRKSVAVLAGVLFALSMLSHGGSAFAFLGLVATLLVLRRRVPWRSTLLAASALLVLYLPWMGYQKFSDPPGDRLLKMHLAGVDQPTSDSFFKVVRNSYAKTPWNQVLATRAENVDTIAGPWNAYWQNYRDFLKQLPHDVFNSDKLAWGSGYAVRAFEFGHFVSALGLYIFGPLFLLAGMGRRFRNERWRAAVLCWSFVLCTLGVWCLTMFVPEGAIIVSGTYLANLLAIAGGVLAFAAVSRWLAIIIVLMQGFVSFLLYVVYVKAPAPGVLAEGVLHRGELILLVIAILLIAAVIVNLPKSESEGMPMHRRIASADSALPQAN